MGDLEWYPYEKRHWYPHMMPRDVAIWEQFISNHSKAFDKVTYDVKVGQGAMFDPTVNENTGGDINDLYQKKIDVVAIAGRNIFVIEIKPRATASSLGQVKAYVKLFKRDYYPADPVAPVVITDEIMPDMKYLAEEEGVTIVRA